MHLRLLAGRSTAAQILLGFVLAEALFVSLNFSPTQVANKV
jgi:hypothetical protein